MLTSSVGIKGRSSWMSDVRDVLMPAPEAQDAIMQEAPDVTRAVVPTTASTARRASTTMLLLLTRTGRTRKLPAGLLMGGDINHIGGRRLEVYDEVGADNRPEQKRKKTSFSGWTMLMIVSHKGRIECVDYLIEQGADLDLMNPAQQTSLVIAASRGHAEVVQRLCRASGVRAQFVEAAVAANANGHPECSAILVGHVDHLFCVWSKCNRAP